ncbi:MAG: winged helix-turn-helix domain-containing protein [Pyrinomonadaceae bacterium]
MSLNKKEIFEFGDFRLDVNERVIERLDGTEIGNLPEKAFETLVILVRRRGHLVLKDELISALWPNTIVEENNLDKQIHLLRRFVGEAETGGRLIETVRKHGYRFVAPVRKIEVSGSWLQDTYRDDDGPDDLKTYGHSLRSTANLASVKGELSQPRNYNSIAVLSFANLGRDAEDEFFCDGLAEELLNTLAKINGLNVAARTSSFSFKGKSGSIVEIGRFLNVKTVLEGSVRRNGDRVRITAQLIDASNGYHIWSERYDRRIQDIFDIQDEITLAIAEALKVTLLGDTRAAVLKRSTDNHEAYELYLHGRFHHNKYTEQGRVKAIEYFEKAIAIEPKFASAYSGTALSLGTSLFFGSRPHKETVPQWKAAVTRALELDDELSEAHMAHALFQFYYERNFETAEKEFRLAAQLNPSNVDARYRYGLFLATMDRDEQAIDEAQKALNLDPLSLVAKFFAGWIYFCADKYDETIDQIRQMTELEPNSHLAYWLKAQIFLIQKNYEGAVDASQRSLKISRQQFSLSILGFAYAKTGREKEARGVIDELLEMNNRGFPVAFSLARVYAGLEQLDQAYKWLDVSFEERHCYLVYLETLASAGNGVGWGESFSADPRYKDLLSRIGFPISHSAESHR